ncbi:hypothetical protein [Bradyrhizobium sp. Gha]|uniref:hypothetical protein n=1 Tax=Bradyrhizobium sp. Gha TaxID=1855318 RepID=UPI0008F1C88B|nr:hypothetical protein [Bradyrhizobium sp. Gha]SFK22952.1 hypothetical protein SAMN05216525_16616 [Bradyrhizobium sp. Gha]
MESGIQQMRVPPNLERHSAGIGRPAPTLLERARDIVRGGSTHEIARLAQQRKFIWERLP